MKVITKYVACDEKEFYDEDDCLYYELNELRNQITQAGGKVLNANFLPVKDPNDNLTYFVAPNETALKLIEDYFDILGFIFPESASVGTYAYDFDYDVWYSLTEKIADLQNKLFLCES